MLGIAIVSLIGTMVRVWNSERSSEAVVGLTITIIVSLGIITFFSLSKLMTTVDDKAIYYRFPPFVNSEKSLTKDDISEVYVRKYKPLTEYGGWGYRVRPGKGRALNVSGNMGLQIIRKNGKALLIGTQKPKELEKAIDRLKENWKLNG